MKNLFGGRPLGRGLSAPSPLTTPTATKVKVREIFKRLTREKMLIKSQQVEAPHCKFLQRFYFTSVYTLRTANVSVWKHDE